MADAEDMEYEDDWLPIEAAPRDGTPVLVFLPLFVDGLFRGSMTTAYYDRDRWQLVEVGGNAEDGNVCPDPTHWMDLPDPPRSGMEKLTVPPPKK